MGLLASKYDRDFHRPPQRRPRCTGPVRDAYPDANLSDRPVAGGDRQYRHPSHPVYDNGKLLYDWPISSGRPGDYTPDGSYLTIEKENPVQMVGPGYSISVPWSVRFTFSGDYYHDAYWSVGEQGFENVSHGCVNLSPADAETYYNLAVPATPSPSSAARQLVPGTTAGPNGPQLAPVPPGQRAPPGREAGPGGSVFVKLAFLPPSTATAPLQTSPANNSAAK